jgi:hypothetical protein
VSGVQDSRSAGRSTQAPPDPIVRKIHPSEIPDVMVARRATVRVAARVGLERRHCMPARCGHCSTCASDQMLRRIIPTAKRTVTRGSNKKTIDKGDAIRERPPPRKVIWAVLRSDRLRPYVRPVFALAHERWPRWFPRCEFQTPKRPLAASGKHGVSRVLDRLITPSARCLASSSIGSARLQLSCSPCLADLYAAPVKAAGADFAA